MTETIPCGTPGATHKRHDYGPGGAGDAACTRCGSKRIRAPRSKPVPREDFPEPMPIPGVPSWARVRQAATVGAILTAPEIAGIVARIDAGDPVTPALLRELRRAGVERRNTETSDTDPAPSTGSSALREMTSGGTVPQGAGSVPITPVTEAASQSLTVGGPNEGGMKLPATVTPASVVGGEGTPIVTFDPPSEPQQGSPIPPCPAAALPPTGPAASLVPPAAGPVTPPRCWQCGGAGRVAGDTFESLECDCAWNNSGNCVPVCRCVNAGSATTCPRCAEVGPGPRVIQSIPLAVARQFEALATPTPIDRTKYLGSSDIGAILGLSPHRTVWDVFASKTGAMPDNSDAIHLRLGLALEPVIAQFACEAEGFVWSQKGSTLFHPSEPWAGATADYDVVTRDGDPGILECKAVGLWSPWYDDEVPLHIVAQVHWQAGIAIANGRSIRRLFVARLKGMVVQVFEVRYEPALFARMLAKGREFWAMVEAGTPPPIDGSEAATAWLQHVYPARKAPLRAATPAEQALIHDYMRAREDEGAAKDRKATAGNLLRASIGAAEGIEAPGAVARLVGETRRIDVRVKEERKAVA